jgi:hypothetical protein
MKAEIFHKISDDLARIERRLERIQKGHAPQSGARQTLEAMRAMTWALHCVAKEQRKGGWT